MKAGPGIKGADRYAVGKIERYDQTNNAYFRSVWDPKLVELGEKYFRVLYPKDKPGYRLEDMSFSQAGWYAFFVKADDLLGYGKQADPRHYWD